MLFTISFDLKGSDPSVYSDIYCWVHANDGYKYVLLETGLWGRLPDSCVVMPYNTEDQIIAAQEFAINVYSEFGYECEYVCATKGEPSGYSQVQSPPRYALNRIEAIQSHQIKKTAKLVGKAIFGKQ